MKKIGVLGGTFDPIHLGHIEIAKKSFEYLNLDLIIFVPCGIPPHKSTSNLSDSSHRINMTNIAIQNYDNFIVSNYETSQKDTSYTVDTLAHFKKFFDDCLIYFICNI